MAIPCLMYLASIGTCSSIPQANVDTLINTADVAMGILNTYEKSGPRGYSKASDSVSISYLSVSLSLNVLLTLMIVVRLILHIRNVRSTIGALDGSSRLYTATATVATMLIESYALYAMNLLIYVVPVAINNWVAVVFSAAIGPIQVRAVFTVPRCVTTLGYRCLTEVTRRS